MVKDMPADYNQQEVEGPLTSEPMFMELSPTMRRLVLTIVQRAYLLGSIAGTVAVARRLHVTMSQRQQK